ncbi:MAG TPA: (2Fe-2S)-binding protein [Aliidongia sp.]|uniref:(2Fe-2S)-binding protein n=1 Tax=Aliidongia sp. TaxID=1914230 RepID=UPI002DDD0C1C|nr:(2Fe-2S)-binding protein [Aliidongia sp.]HEV2673258.1 (2Fe-2S)-binding protein [Aliidongia sp.]
MTIRNLTRREFLRDTAATGGAVAVAGQASLGDALAAPPPVADRKPELHQVTIRLNGTDQQLRIDPRTTLLDLLREHLHLTGTKKGCDMGACGACTVLLDGKRVNACLLLAARLDHREVQTIEGLANGEELHPLQAAFIEHDGFQCGYCTPGQIMSAAGLLNEGRPTDERSIREWMSGNICRCGAYPNIVTAIRQASGRA